MGVKRDRKTAAAELAVTCKHPDGPCVYMWCVCVCMPACVFMQDIKSALPVVKHSTVTIRRLKATYCCFISTVAGNLMPFLDHRSTSSLYLSLSFTHTHTHAKSYVFFCIQI